MLSEIRRGGAGSVVVGVLAAVGLSSGAIAQSTMLKPSGYTETFDGMTTQPPEGWSVWQLPGNAATFSGSVSATGVGGGVKVSPAGAPATFSFVPAGVNLPSTGIPDPSAAGYIFSSSLDPSKKALGTSPSNDSAASVVQLVLSNQTGGEITQALVVYSCRVISPTQTEELRGYRVFTSSTGETTGFTAQFTLNSTVSTLNNAGDVITRAMTIVFPQPIAPGANLTIRFVDDNGSSAVDQAYAIDDVHIVPTFIATPGLTGACCRAGGCVMASPVDCDSAGQSFAGLFTVCSGDGAQRCCPADVTGDSMATIDDIFVYMNLWFGGSIAADTNHNDSISIDDLFVFLNVWFTGC